MFFIGVPIGFLLGALFYAKMEGHLAEQADKRAAERELENKLRDITSKLVGLRIDLDGLTVTYNNHTHSKKRTK